MDVSSPGEMLPTPDGGRSSAVQHQLKDVQQIQASSTAFAAILSDGSAVTWGNAADVVTVVLCRII